jgi:hypothetical protein
MPQLLSDFLSGLLVTLQCLDPVVAPFAPGLKAGGLGCRTPEVLLVQRLWLLAAPTAIESDLLESTLFAPESMLLEGNLAQRGADFFRVFTPWAREAFGANLQFDHIAMIAPI